MSKKLSKGLTLLAGLIGLIGFYFFVRIMMAGDESIENDAAVQASIVSPFISFAKWVLILTTLVAVIFSMINLVKHPQVLKRTLLGLGILAVFLVVSYVLASDGAVTDGLGKILPEGEAGSISKWVSTGINFSGFLGAIGVIFFVVDFAKGLVK